jgi:hypothetical protein
MKNKLIILALLGLFIIDMTLVSQLLSMVSAKNDIEVGLGVILIFGIIYLNLFIIDKAIKYFKN